MPEFNASAFERGMDFIPLLNQVDCNSDVTGDWIKLTNHSRVGFLFAKYGTEDVDDIGLQFLQSLDAAGTSSKALSLPANRPIFYKTGTLTAQTVWTQTSGTAAIDGIAVGSAVPTGFTRVVADVDTAALLLYTELLATDLDVDGSFDWVTAFVAGGNINNACLISVWAVLMGGRFPQAVPLSAIS